MDDEGQAIDPIDTRTLTGRDGGFPAVDRVPRTAAILQPVGETVVLPAALPPGETCRLEYCGSSSNAVNGGKSPIAAGQRARIDRVNGLTLVVHGENS